MYEATYFKFYDGHTDSLSSIRGIIQNDKSYLTNSQKKVYFIFGKKDWNFGHITIEEKNFYIKNKISIFEHDGGYQLKVDSNDNVTKIYGMDMTNISYSEARFIYK